MTKSIKLILNSMNTRGVPMDIHHKNVDGCCQYCRVHFDVVFFSAICKYNFKLKFKKIVINTPVTTTQLHSVWLNLQYQGRCGDARPRQRSKLGQSCHGLCLWGLIKKYRVMHNSIELGYVVSTTQKQPVLYPKGVFSSSGICSKSGIVELRFALLLA